MSSGACVEQKGDPYTIREGGAAAPPTSWRKRLRHLGPSVVISGAIVGSGEMILTSGLGAAAGFVMLWWVLLSCWIKSLIQAELARYTLASGDTYVRAMNRLPFRIRIGRGHVSFAVAITLIALVPGLLGMGGIIGGAGQALTLLVPEVPSTLAAGLLAAITTAETSAYQYWCVEKGYPNFIGRSDAPGWETRARGWIKVMQTDVWVTLILLTCATVPFYLLGAGVLKKLGREPDGPETISMLSEMFTQTLGPWSLWLFGVGAFCILFSTMISFIAGEARYIPDYIMELGYLKRRNLAARRSWIRGYCTIVPIFCFIVYTWIQNPRLLITIGALVAGMLLPIQSGAVLWLQKKRMDPRIRPGRGIRAGIWAIFLVELALAGLVIRYVALEPLLN